MGLRHAAVRADDRRQREAIDVVDLACGERQPRLDDFVAGRQNRHAGTFVDLDVTQPIAARAPTRPGVSTSPDATTTRSRRDVRAAPADVLAAVRGFEDRHQILAKARRVLDHHHGVGAIGKGRAGGDFRAESPGRSMRGASVPCTPARRCEGERRSCERRRPCRRRRRRIRPWPLARTAAHPCATSRRTRPRGRPRGPARRARFASTGRTRRRETAPRFFKGDRRRKRAHDQITRIAGLQDCRKAE